MTSRLHRRRIATIVRARRWRTLRQRLAIACCCVAAGAVGAGALVAGGALSGTPGPSTNTITGCAPGTGDPLTRDGFGFIHCTPLATATSTSTTSSSTSTSTTTSTTRPQSVTCAATPTQRITGTQADAYDASAPGLTDASTAVWRRADVGLYPVSAFSTASGATWCGGRILGNETNPLTAHDNWDTYHGSGGFRFSQPSMTVRRVESSFLGDAFKPKDDGGHATTWRLDHVFSDHAYDDCIEDDYLHAGTVTDSWLECYVGISTRASAGQGTAADGTVTVDHTTLVLEPQSNVYKGTSPGTGGWFKMGDAVRSPDFVLRDSVFYAQQLPNHQDLNPPTTITACSGVRVLWGASSAFPAATAWRSACPDVVIVTGSAARTELALRRAVWLNS